MTPDERRQIEQAILGRDATSAARALEPIIDAMLADRDAKIARFADLLATSSKNANDALSMTNELAFTERDLPEGWERTHSYEAPAGSSFYTDEQGIIQFVAPDGEPLTPGQMRHRICIVGPWQEAQR